MSYINSIKVGDTTYPISLNESTIGDGLQLTKGVLTPNLGKGLQINETSKTMEVNLGTGLDYDTDNKIIIPLGAGLQLDEENKITLKIGSGLTLGSDGTLSISN